MPKKEERGFKVWYASATDLLKSHAYQGVYTEKDAKTDFDRGCTPLEAVECLLQEENVAGLNFEDEEDDYE